MKKILLSFVSIAISMMLHAQVSKTVNLTTEATLSTLLTNSELSTITDLTLTGTINVLDFVTMANMKSLKNINIADVSITTGYYNYFINKANEIPYLAFQDDTLLTSIILPNSLKSIGQQAFQGCTNLTSITIPPSDTAINDCAFEDCPKLTTMHIPALVNNIGDAVFNFDAISFTVDPNNQYYTSIDGILFDKSLTHLIHFPPDYSGDYIIPSTVTGISGNAFYKCGKLNSVTIPQSVTASIDNAFFQCSGTFIVDANNPNYKSVDGLFYNKYVEKLFACPTSKTGDIILPSTVTSIYKYAFSLCNKLSSVTISSKVTSIGVEPFAGSSANVIVDASNTKYSSIDGVLYNSNQSILISCPTSKTGHLIMPSTTSTFGVHAFMNCSNLKSIEIKMSNPPTFYDNLDNIFNGVDYNNCVLYVPSGSESKYKSYPKWKRFKNIKVSTGFIIDKNTVAFTTADASTSEVSIVASEVWIANDDQSWLSVYPSSGDAGNDIFTISTLANTGSVERTATITISTSLGAQTITITQPASGTTSINDIAEKKDDIYPNPAHSVFYVNTEDRATVEVYNFKNELIITKQLSCNVAINTSELASGLYLVKVIKEKDVTIHTLIVK